MRDARRPQRVVAWSRELDASTIGELQLDTPAHQQTQRRCRVARAPAITRFTQSMRPPLDFDITRRTQPVPRRDEVADEPTPHGVLVLLGVARDDAGGLSRVR